MDLSSFRQELLQLENETEERKNYNSQQTLKGPPYACVGPALIPWLPGSSFAPAPSDRSPFYPLLSRAGVGTRISCDFESLVAMLSFSFIWATRVRMGLQIVGDP